MGENLQAAVADQEVGYVSEVFLGLFFKAIPNGAFRELNGPV